jgi:Hypervirulence associated proteins TUDOR domain
MSLHDFSVDYRRQIVLSYPDKAWVRCQNGMPQRAAHWSPRPAGKHFELRAMSRGGSVGRVERKLISPGKIKGLEITASEDNPELPVRSDKSGKIAAHKPSALRRVR